MSSTRSGGSKKSTSARRTGTSKKRSAAPAGKVTTDHDEIREWVEARGGTPASVSGTERRSQAAGLLRIDFPGYSGEGTLEPIDWDEFFDKFENSNLAFLHESKKGSRFNKFISRKGNSRRSPSKR